jgi:hypothetical protein
VLLPGHDGDRGSSRKPGLGTSAKGVQQGDLEGVVHEKVWGFWDLSLEFP